MRLANVATPYGFRVGAVETEGVVDLQAAEVSRLREEGMQLADALAQAATALPSDMMAFLAAGPPAMAAAHRALEYARRSGSARPIWYPVEAIEYGPVVPRPSKIFVMRGNYELHRAEMAPRLGTAIERPDRPRYFMKPPTTVIGHGQPIIYPRISREVHHEIELAVVIGRPGRWIPPERVTDYLAGYTIFLDMTARDLSGKDDRNKSFDTFGPIGPFLVPVQDIADPDNLSLVLRVNGEVRQQGNTRDLQFKVPEIVSFLSEAISLLPGDVISTGTPAGVGPVKPGDIIEAEIESIGLLRCPVVAEPGPQPGSRPSSSPTSQ